MYGLVSTAGSGSSIGVSWSGKSSHVLSSDRLNGDALGCFFVVIEGVDKEVDLGPCGCSHPLGEANIEVPLQVVLSHGEGPL